MTTLLEGGNLTIDGKQADHLDLKVTKRSFIVPVLDKLLHTIDSLYKKQFKTPLWDPKVLNDKSFLSGSSLHFFNVKGISDDQFVKVKPKVGDIDTMVDKDKEANLAQLLTSIQGKDIGDVKLVGFQRGNEQYSSLWEIGNPPSIKVQIDFEFVDFNKGTPTDWAKFSHSSSWEDLQLRIKGVFHKFLIQSLASLTYRSFLQRKAVGRGKARAEQDVPISDNMLSFAVSSKEGGGLRAKYVPVLDPTTNKPLVKDGLPVMTAAPAANYEKDLSKIFTSLFGKKIDPKSLERTWSFNGLLDLMNKLLTPEQKQQVFNQFLQKTIGTGAQGLYKNDPNRDLEEKMVAINHAMKQLKVSKPSNLDQMVNDYKKAYKMVANEATETPNYKRQGIQHIYNPGSSVEIKDADFIELCKEIASLGGKLDKAPINLKVDGAGIRFGKDEQGKPFFMTSKVTEPKYIENYGDFEQYGRSAGQDEQRLAFTKNYDEALKTILTADFMKDIPADTIVQAEMLYNPMAQKSDQGYRFVNIDYDPKLLGSTMTLVPFSVKQYSTGQPRKDSEQIKQKLLKDSTKQIKMVNNQLSQKDINLSSIVDPIVKNSNGLLTALKTRGDSPQKEQAKEIISLAKKKLSDAIYNSKNIKGRDQLGKNIEGLVINMPSGKLLKVTSPQMKDKMAAKKAPTKTGPSKTAVVAIGSFVGHKGHEELWKLTKDKAKEVGGDPYLFIGSGLGKDDPIPPAVKVKTWQTLYPEYKNNISTVNVQGGSLMQKIKHELINPTPGQPPKYDNIIIMVGEDQKDMSIAQALMKAVNKFPGYEHVKVELNPTPRGTGISFTQLRNILKDPNASEGQKLAVWTKAFDVDKLGVDYIKYLMQVTEKGMTDLKEQIREFIESVKPLLPTATPKQRQKIHSMLSEAKKQLEAANAAQQAAIAISMKKAGKKPKKKVSETIDYLPEK